MKYYTKFISLMVVLGVMSTLLQAQNDGYNHNKFKQLKEELATPNVYRTGSGAPGHEYYQQQADYMMDIILDDENQRIYGEASIVYKNNSPNPLEYLWVQLDQNVRSPESDTYKIRSQSFSERMSFGQIERLHHVFEGGFNIDFVQDVFGNELDVSVNKTMMRIHMEVPLAPGESFTFKTKWWYNINNRMTDGGGRSGSEYFAADDNYLYTIAQFYPRMAVYNDVEGWQNKQFLGSGEFALTFGDYEVSITVPSDHLVSSTGELKNANDILSDQKLRLLEEAKTADTPVIIFSEAEAIDREKNKAKSTKTWIFEAENVRDFGFASSRKFIWDAMGVQFGDRTVMAMSMYPKEGNPLWEQFSTRAVAHTLEIYSRYTFDYPYPVAWSVNAANIGMEYPMICFNFGRTEADGTYSERTKYGMIGVIIHEVGHNFFPMIVNSDERQWTWMDEGLNTFLQYLTEQEWERDYPSRRGPAPNIVNYMKGDTERISPIMTNSESIWQFGNNAYGKPATALNILRETVMGRELFDYAFKTYAQRWMFKHPTPADFFRTMEDASAVDLDWFWRGWFYTNWHVDQGIKEIKWFQIDTRNPETEEAFSRKLQSEEPDQISTIRDDNEKLIEETWVEREPAAADFYTTYDPLKVTLVDIQEYDSFISRLNEDEKALLNSGMNYCEITFENVGELVMPIIVQFTYSDGSVEEHRIPAEIWRMNDKEVSKVFFSEKDLTQVKLDPFLEIADTDLSNNYWPERVIPSRFELFKSRGYGQAENPMQRQQRAQQLEEN